MWVISSRWLRPCPLYTPPVAPTDWMVRWGSRILLSDWFARKIAREVTQTLPFRGRRSRNKVSVGEPAEGSLTCIHSLSTANFNKTGTAFYYYGQSLFFNHNQKTNHSDLKNLSLVLRHIQDNKKPTTLNGGSLGSYIDEERCELRYVMRIAQLSESLKFWTHIALL